MDNISKVATDATIIVTVVQAYPPKADNYGKNKMSAKVSWKGQQYYANFSEKQFPLCVANRSVMGIKKEYQGKAYYEWAEDPHSQALSEPAMQNPTPMSVPAPMRDFDAENRGKTRCQVLCAMIASGKEFELPKYRTFINEAVEFIFTGK